MVKCPPSLTISFLLMSQFLGDSLQALPLLYLINSSPNALKSALVLDSSLVILIPVCHPGWLDILDDVLVTPHLTPHSSKLSSVLYALSGCSGPQEANFPGLHHLGARVVGWWSSAQGRPLMEVDRQEEREAGVGCLLWTEFLGGPRSLH